VIQALEVAQGGYNVFPGGGWPGNSTNDPADCTSVVPFYTIRVANLAALEDRENVAKTLLAAYLAGRKVQLYVHGTQCNGTSPYYYGAMVVNESL
jgi:hypothetical protein